MSVKKQDGPSIDEIMTYWSRGRSLQETADHFGKTYRVIEQMVSRYGYRYERAFNFPHVIHAKRFGA
jgi:hypothetical protein